MPGPTAIRPTVVSFFTPNAPYPDFAARLKKSCERLGLDHLISGIPAEATWVETVAQKPAHLLRWARLVEGPILWVDADGELLREPELLCGCEKDFAIYADSKPRKWKPIGRSQLELPKEWPDPPRWFLTGTIWVNDTVHGLAFLDEWAQAAAREPKAYQQLLCQKVWCRVKPDTLWLPQSYCRIRGHGWRGRERGPVVIEHDLASTRLKGVVRK